MAEDKIQTLSLLDLPPEIWSRIGKLVIDDGPYLNGCNLSSIRFWRGRALNGGSIDCRVLRGELLPYYYKTRIAINCAPPSDQYIGFKDTSDCRFLVEWLKLIGIENRRHVRGVVRTLQTILPHRDHPGAGIEEQKDEMERVMREEWLIEGELVQTRKWATGIDYMFRFL